MESMPPDQPPASAEPTPIEVGSVVEFGAEEKPRRPRVARFSVVGWVSAVAADRRLVPVAAALGGVALFASSVSEWQVTKIDATLLGGDQVGMQPVASGVADLGASGAGYLLGVFALVAAAVLVLFGPAPGRRYARLIGLSTGGTLLALLAGLASDLGDSSRALGRAYSAQVAPEQVQISYGRGLWCAVFGVAAVTLALVVAGRHLLPPEHAAAEPAAGVDPVAEQVPVDEAPPVWSWRKPRDVGEEDGWRPEEPFDLTVRSAKPFTPSGEDRDKPT
jgi:hypothetical protein